MITAKAPAFIDSLISRSKISPEESKQIDEAVKRLSVDQLDQLSEHEITKLGIPERHRAAFVYFALARKYPDLIPNAAATSVSEGLKSLSELRDPIAKEKLESVVQRLQNRAGEERFVGGGVVGHVDDGPHLMRALRETMKMSYGVKMGAPWLPDQSSR